MGVIQVIQSLLFNVLMPDEKTVEELIPTKFYVEGKGTVELTHTAPHSSNVYQRKVKYTVTTDGGETFVLIVNGFTARAALRSFMRTRLHTEEYAEYCKRIICHYGSLDVLLAALDDATRSHKSQSMGDLRTAPPRSRKRRASSLRHRYKDGKG